MRIYPDDKPAVYTAAVSAKPGNANNSIVIRLCRGKNPISSFMLFMGEDEAETLAASLQEATQSNREARGYHA